MKGVKSKRHVCVAATDSYTTVIRSASKRLETVPEQLRVHRM